MLSLILILILLGIVFILSHRSTISNLNLQFIILLAGTVFCITIIILVFFDRSTVQPQFISTGLLGLIYYPLVHINLVLDINNGSFQEYGIDGLSIFFVLLTTLLVFLCLVDV